PPPLHELATHDVELEPLLQSPGGPRHRGHGGVRPDISLPARHPPLRSCPTERQQIKWAVFASAVVLAVTVATAVVEALDPTLSLGYRPGDRGVIFQLLA